MRTKVFHDLAYIYLSSWSPFPILQVPQFMCADSLLFHDCTVLSLTGATVHAVSSTWKASLSLLALHLRLVHGSGCSGNHSLQKDFSKSLGPRNDAPLIWAHGTWDWPLVQHCHRIGTCLLSVRPRGQGLCVALAFSMPGPRHIKRCSQRSGIKQIHGRTSAYPWFRTHRTQLEPPHFIESTWQTKKYKRKVRHLLFKMVLTWYWCCANPKQGSSAS